MSNQNKLYLPKFCVVPLEARQNPDIPDSAKIYLGELNVLTNQYGYCWASDADLAEMKGVSTSTINSWHRILEKHGFIKRDTWRSHQTNENGKLEVRSMRKLYVFEEPSKIVSECQKSGSRSECQKSGSRSECQKSGNINKESLNKESINRSIDLSEKILKCVQSLNLSNESKAEISRYCTDIERLKGAIDYALLCNEPIDDLKGLIIKNYDRGFKPNRNQIKAKEEVEEKEQRILAIQENRAFAENAIKNVRFPDFTDGLKVKENEVQAHRPSGLIVIYFCDKKFKEKLELFIEKFGKTVD